MDGLLLMSLVIAFCSLSGVAFIVFKIIDEELINQISLLPEIKTINQLKL